MIQILVVLAEKASAILDCPPHSLGRYLETGLIKCVNIGGEMAPKQMLDPSSVNVFLIKKQYIKNCGDNLRFFSLYNKCDSCKMKVTLWKKEFSNSY